MMSFIRWMLNQPPSSSKKEIEHENEETVARVKTSRDLERRMNRLLASSQSRGTIYRDLIESREGNRNAH